MKEEEASRRLREADERPFIPPRQRPSFPSFWPDFHAASPRSRWGEGKVDSQPTETRGWHGMVCSLQVERRRVERGSASLACRPPRCAVTWATIAGDGRAGRLPLVERA